MTRRKDAPSCGTQGGYNLHRYHREAPCPECREAHNTWTRLEVRAARIIAARYPDEKRRVLDELKRDAGI